MSVEILQSLSTVAKYYQTGTTKVVKTNVFYHIAMHVNSVECDQQQGCSASGAFHYGFELGMPTDQFITCFTVQLF